MKTAIYITEGSTQVVLTPENEWEKQVIASIESGQKSLSIHRGGFYECQGGWVRQSGGEESLILRTQPASAQP